MADQISETISTTPDRRATIRGQSWRNRQLKEDGDQDTSFRLTYQAIKNENLSEDEFVKRMTNLLDLANRDKLTGLENRRSFFERVDREWKEANQRGEKLSAVLLDIDHFKDINDKFGHKAGDDVLTRLGPEATSIGADLGGWGFRVGGEEFIFILPDVEGEELVDAAKTIGIRLIHNWTDDTNLIRQGIERVTVSIGAGTNNKPDETLEQFLGRIDHNLYEAKEGGRQMAKIETEPGKITEVRFANI